MLLPAVALGDVAAFEALYDRYAPLLYGLLLRILSNAEDAREALQETFVKAWTSAEMFDAARGSEASWLISVARSRGIDRLRSRRVRLERENDAGREISIQTTSVDQETAADRAIQSEESSALRDGLAGLPEAQRIALELAYFEGLSQAEIADRLGQPLGTVKTRMQLGMKKLRERLRTVLGR